MNAETFPEKFYRDKRIDLEELLKVAKGRRSALAWIRFGTIMLALVGGYMAWEHQDFLWLIAVLAGLAGFGRAIAVDADNTARIKRLEGLKRLVDEESAFLTEGKAIPGNEKDIPDMQDHPYSFDLDIFGKGSVFAMVNRCPSEVGRTVMASWLLGPAPRATILERQESVKELAKHPDDLFDLRAMGQESPLRQQTVTRILAWLNDTDQPFKETYWTIVKWAYPIITLGVLGFYSFGKIPSSVFGLSCILFLAISSAFSKQVIKHYTALSGIVKEVAVLSESVAFIESRSNTQTLNKRIQDTLKNPEGASAQIRSLDGLLNRFDYRLNPYIFLFLNAFLLWDLWQMHGLSKWKQNNRVRVDQWVECVATMEALGSLALLHFNRPGWCFPDISERHFEFEATGLGHPLIPESKRVTNDFEAKVTGQLELVTGSNMAGKSTFLRTVGVNMILAMAGGPVCAETCRVSPVKLASSMRIADNLEDSTSTFYAELKKLRNIIELVKSKEPSFILLDEILRGTNSRDRLAGSKALVRQMVRDEAVGIIATHDLELAQMEEELPGHIQNYYFDVHFFGDQLDFDYKLRHGVCTTKNAELLMKQIGIEI